MAASAQRPRVLVIRGGAVGDFILTLPAIQLLRDSIPNAHVEVLGYAPIVALATAAGLAEASRNLEHATMARLFVPKATLEPSLEAWLRSFNLVVSYLYDPDEILRGNMEALGIRTYLATPHQVVDGAGHAAAQLARPLEKLAMFLEAPYVSLPIPARIPESDPAAKYLAIHPGSGSERKNWPVEYWITAGQKLQEEHPEYTLALITGEAEVERGTTDKILHAWRSQRMVHWDQLPLPELAGRLRVATAFLGHDSGISHLAAACDTPSCLLFGPTDPEIWAPPQPFVRVHVEESGDLGSLSLERGITLFSTFLRAL